MRKKIIMPSGNVPATPPSPDNGAMDNNRKNGSDVCSNGGSGNGVLTRSVSIFLLFYQNLYF